MPSPEASALMSVIIVTAWRLRNDALATQILADRWIEAVHGVWGKDTRDNRPLELFLELTVPPKGECEPRA